MLEQCEEAGLLPPGGTTPGAPASAASGRGGELPDTGGPNLPALLGVPGVLAVAGGLLARKVAAG